MSKKKFQGTRHALNSLWWKLKIRFQRLPLMGEIGGKTAVPAAKINSKKFGTSSGLSMAVEIKVNRDESIPEGVGKIVKTELFLTDDYADRDFIFNVCFSCGKASIFKKGLYTDPKSHWFNVFFGYYEIDVPAETWKRPFGYAFKNGALSIEFRDLRRIGLADWNYFSNYLYGVPRDPIEKCNDPDNPGIEDTDMGRIQIKGRFWDHVGVDKFRVVSAYTSPGHEHLLQERSIWTPMWRLSYGRPHPRKGIDECFFPCSMKAQFYMSYTEGYDTDMKKTAYKTLIFGGTVNHDCKPDTKKYTRIQGGEKGSFDLESFNDEFLSEQMNAVKKVIEKEFAHLGFQKASR